MRLNSLYCMLIIAAGLMSGYHCCFSSSAGRGSVVRRPVIYMHGILPDRDEADFPQTYIKQKLPGTVLYNIDLFYEKLTSVLKIDYQLEYIIPAMMKIMEAHRDTGVTLLCYSQGGFICRAVVEQLTNHNIHTLITLSSPLAGQYGLTSVVEKALPFLPPRDRKYLWEFFYTKIGQDNSVGNYWNDPHHQMELSHPSLNVTIARLNNQTGHKQSQEYKSNFIRLETLVMIGGPDDAVITPWQSAHFGYYDQNETVLSYDKQPWYIQDDFGLRTLDKAGKIVTHSVPGVHHEHWYKTAAVYDCCVLPYIN